jgi:hypothetical protein
MQHDRARLPTSPRTTPAHTTRLQTGSEASAASFATSVGHRAPTPSAPSEVPSVAASEVPSVAASFELLGAAERDDLLPCDSVSCIGAPSVRLEQLSVDQVGVVVSAYFSDKWGEATTQAYVERITQQGWAGIDLAQVHDDDLRDACAITSSVHRRTLLRKFRDFEADGVPRELLGGEAADATFAFLDEAQARLHGDISPSQPSATATEDEGVVPPTAAAPRAHHMESNERMTTSLSSYAATEDEIIPPSTAAARTANMESAEGRSTISAAQTAAEYAFKVLVVGSSSVGKSSLLCRLMDDTYNEDLPATYGVDLKFQSYLLDGVRIKLVFWDTGIEPHYP